MNTRMMRYVLMVLVTASTCRAADQPEMEQIQREGNIRRCLFSVIPIAITNSAPYQGALDRVMKSVQGKDWSQTSDSLPVAPASSADASRLLHDLVRIPAVAHIEYNGYYIVSDLLPLQNKDSLPVDSEAKLKARLTQLVLENPETFMSGFVIPKGSSKWMKYDFTTTYTMTPKGVKIEKTKSAEPPR